MLEVFQRLAVKTRETVDVEYTGDVPHLDPETGEVVNVEGDSDTGGESAAK